MPAPPEIKKLSFREQANIVKWLMHFASLPLIVILRRDVGYRTLNPLHLIGTALGMVVIASLASNNPDNRPADLMFFAGMMLVFGFWQKFRRWRDIGNAISQHSYYIGTSRFRFRWLPGFLKRNRRIERFFDPLYCFAVGLIVAQVSPALGLWLMVSALCQRFIEYDVWLREMHRDLDTVDGLINAEIQGDVVEEFTEPTGRAGQGQPATGVPTGLGEDIQAKIAQRKAQRG